MCVNRNSFFVLCVCLCQNMSYAHYTHNNAVWVMGLAN